MMCSKLLYEYKQPVGENQHCSFQAAPAPPKTKTGQKDVTGCTSPEGKKELDTQTKEIAVLHEYKFLKHQHVLCSEGTNNLKECLQEPLRRLEERNKKLLKEKNRILEGRKLLIKQENVLKAMQIKLNHLLKELKYPELIESRKNSKELKILIETLGARISQEREKVDNGPSSPTQQIAVLKQAQKSGYLKKFYFPHCCRSSVGLFVRYLLYCSCLILIILLVYEYLPDLTWPYQLDLPDTISHLLWIH